MILFSWSGTFSSREARRSSIGNATENRTARESAPDEGRAREELTGRSENGTKIEENYRRRDTAKSGLSLSSKQPELNKSTLEKNINKRTKRSGEPVSKTAVSLLRESPKISLDQYRLSSVEKSNIDRAIDKVEVSSLDSGDCTTATTSTAADRNDGTRDVETRKLTIVSDKRRRFLVSDAPAKINGLRGGGMYGEKFDDTRSDEEDESLENSEVTAESGTDDTVGNAKPCDRLSKIDDDHRAKDDTDRISAKQLFEGKLRDLGIDPEWQGLPHGSFTQMMETISHNRRLNCKVRGDNCSVPFYHFQLLLSTICMLLFIF